MPALEPPFPAGLVSIVEDDPAVSRGLARLLEARDYGVSRYGSAEEFLASDRSDCGCLLLDLTLPGMGGEELFDHLRTQGEELPVIVVTGMDDPEKADALVRRGVRALLRKADPIEDLLEQLERVMDPAS